MSKEQLAVVGLATQKEIGRSIVKDVRDHVDAITRIAEAGGWDNLPDGTKDEFCGFTYPLPRCERNSLVYGISRYNGVAPDSPAFLLAKEELAKDGVSIGIEQSSNGLNNRFVFSIPCYVPGEGIAE